MINHKQTSITEFCNFRNKEKSLFTAGPASLIPENISGLRPCFGRGDSDYERTEFRVLQALAKMTNHQNIARLQGSASLALEILILNFLAGKVLVISSGYYSDRLLSLAKMAKESQNLITEINSVPWTEINEISASYDWILSCYTETSVGLLLPIHDLKNLAKRTNAKLALDATASIGLEPHHDFAEVIAYSSCKGLFGLTGASFIAFSSQPQNLVNSFYLDIKTHLDKRVTGPYHAISSLDEILANHTYFRESVVINKDRFCAEAGQYLSQPKNLQPLLCTHANIGITSKSPQAILYSPRNNLPGSIVCHLGEAQLGKMAKGDILNLLEYKK